MIEIINPKDREHWLKLRAEDITSTECAALFGLSPYQTLFELWHRHRDNLIVEIEENERMKWGTRLQDSIALGVAEDQGWKVRRMDEYIRNPELKMGSSFDFAIEDAGLLEVKNVDSLQFRDGWAVEGDDVEAPPHIEIQVQHQLAVSGRSFAYIAALVGGNRVALIKREPDEKIISEIKKRVASFWFTIAAGEEPKPDFSRDSAFIARLHSYAEPGKILDAHGVEEIADLAAQYRAFGNAKKQAEEQQKAVKAQLLMKIGDAEKVKGEMFTISAGIIGPKHVEYDTAGYRDFRISWKKEIK